MGEALRIALGQYARIPSSPPYYLPSIDAKVCVGKWFSFHLKYGCFKPFRPLPPNLRPPLTGRVQDVLLPHQQKFHRFHGFESFGI
jgi:hypothetical protein